MDTIAPSADQAPTRGSTLTIDPATLERAARVIRVLGHPLRLRILEALEPGERNVAELQEEIVASQAVISQQLGILRANGIVEPRRDGTRVYYRIIEPKVSRILDCIRECDLSTMAEFTTLAAFAGLEPAVPDDRLDSVRRAGRLRRPGRPRRAGSPDRS